MTAILGIVVALEMERRWIGAPQPIVELSGIGERRAENAARRLVGRGATALVSWGVAGGLDPSLRPGTVILPDTIIGADGSRLGADLVWRDRLRERAHGRVETSTSLLYHATSVIRTTEEKHAVFEKFNAAAADMESAAVARVAVENRLPWIAVRVVIDAATQELPATIVTATGDDGRLRMGSIAGLMLRPGLWRPLFSLGRAGVAAGQSMRRLWGASQPDLALS